MKISQSLHKKINPNFIGFTSASLIYLASWLFFSHRFSHQDIQLKQDGNHTILLRISSIDNGGKQTRFIKDPKQTHLQTNPHPKFSKPKKPHKKQSNRDRIIQSTQKQDQQVQQEFLQSNLTQKGNNQIQTLTYNEGISDEFLSKIHNAISTHNQYPRSAKIRKLEGEVIVEFILSQDGTMEELRIIKSRAEEILQKSAIKAIQKAARFFPTPPQRVRIRVPIIYHLKPNF